MTQSLDAIRADWIVPLLKNRIVNGEFRGITLGEACSIIAALEAASLSDQSVGNGWKDEVAYLRKLANREMTAIPSCSFDRPTEYVETEISAALHNAASTIVHLSASPIPVDRRAVLEALTPSGATKAAYIGEFSFTDTREDADGEVRTYKMDVPWTTIKEIMKAIKARALAASPSLANEKEGKAISTDGEGFVREPGWLLNAVTDGFERWKAKSHNKKWVRLIDGTPIQNDLIINIFETVQEALSPAPASKIISVRDSGSDLLAFASDFAFNNQPASKGPMEATIERQRQLDRTEDERLRRKWDGIGTKDWKGLDD